MKNDRTPPTPSSRVLASHEDLIDLLEDLNDRGHFPSVGFVSHDGIVTGVAYGIAKGDTMDYAFLTDPGEERTVGSHGGEEEESYIGDFEQDIQADLDYPIYAIYYDPDAPKVEPTSHLSDEEQQQIDAYQALASHPFFSFVHDRHGPFLNEMLAALTAAVPQAADRG